jgi:hypothetical protein
MLCIGLKKRLPLLETLPELARFLGAPPVFRLIKFRGENFTGFGFRNR